MKRIVFNLLNVLLFLFASNVYAYNTIDTECPLKDCLVDNGIWKDAAVQRGLDPILLYAVALRESRSLWNDGLVRPWPWRINGPDGDIKYNSRQEAEQALISYIEMGYQNIDIGLMQINWRYHKKRVTAPEKLFDPKTNVRIGADILKESLDNTPDDLILGIGRYHAGYNPEKMTRAINYGTSVMSIYKNIIEYLSSN